MTGSTAASHPAPLWATVLAGLVVALVAGVVHFPQLRGPFYDIDDYDNIVLNPKMGGSFPSGLVAHWNSPHMSLYIPVTHTIWHAIAAATRFDQPDDTGLMFPAIGFRVVGWLTFSLCGVLALLLLMELGLPLTASLMAALLFVTHPSQAETVAWITGYRDVLSTTLMIAALLTASRLVGTRAASGPWYWATLLLAALAMLSKPSAIAIAPVMVVFFRYVLDRNWTETWVQCAPMILMAAVVAVVTTIVQVTTAIPNVGMLKRPVVALDTMGFYLGHIAWPVRVAFDYGRTPVSLFEGPLDWITLGLGVIACLGLGILWQLGGARGRLAAMLIVCPLAPVLGLISFQYQGYSTVSDHYLIASFVGLAVVVGMAIERWRWLGAALVVPTIVLGSLAFRHSGRWADPSAMYDQMLKVNPRTLMALNNVSAYYIRQRQPEKSLTYSLRAIELKPDDWGVRFNLAKAYTLLGEFEQALPHWAACMALKPNDPETTLQYAGALWTTGQRDRAIVELKRIAEINPRNQRIQAQLQTLNAWLRRTATTQTDRTVR